MAAQFQLLARQTLIQYPKAKPTADSLGEAEADDGFRYFIKGDATMFARVGVTRALNRHVGCAFNPDRKDHLWGKRKLGRDEYEVAALPPLAFSVNR